MDETEARRLLVEAADEVNASPDLAERTWERYRHRRQVRRRASLAAAVVGLVIGAGALAATLSSNEPQPRITTPGPTSPSVTTVPSTSTTSAPVPGAVDPATLQSPSFVDANTGYAVEGGNAAALGLFRTDDGGRTWRRVAPLPDGKGSVHFANASEGIAWGSGPLFTTTDGGLHWSEPAEGPVDSSVSTVGHTIWALTPCVQAYPCTPHVSVSDDVGQTWRPAAGLEPGFGTSSITAVSRDVAFVVLPNGNGNDLTFAHPIDLAMTRDGGSSWSFVTTPCTSHGDADTLLLAFNGRTLLLVCAQVAGAGGEHFDEYSSTDTGHTWTTLSTGPAAGGYSRVLVAVGSTFVLGSDRGTIRFSTDGGAIWQAGIDTGESYPSVSVTPGIGVYVATGRADRNAGIWFSADGIHWEQRS